MKKRVLITGGAGFIGSHLCDYLIARGYFVICMDNLITGSMENTRHLLNRKDFRFVKHDVTKYINIKGALNYVLHFASPASPVDYLRYPIKTLKVGSLGTHNALGLAKLKNSGFLLASTSEIYGDPLINPQPESYWGNVNPIGVRACYDEAKRFAEAITMAYRRDHKVNTRIVRIFNTYGERMREKDGRVIPNFISQAESGAPLTVYGTGSQTRSFCYVSDMVKGIYRLMLSNMPGPVNIGNPNEMSVLKLAKTIIKMTGRRSGIVYKRLPSDDPRVRRPDIKLARTCLKWKPEIPLEKGLGITIKWFKEKQARGKSAHERNMRICKSR